MNSSSPFIRKIIYIALIGALLIPLSLVSRPETRNGDGAIVDAGGQLSMLREEHDLSQAKMSEIDPASETMKLASLGLRGVAVNMLWMQAMDHKKKENYDQLASTLKALTKIQPSFVKVWEFQAHNLAYNVSMEFDDYEYRYHWVKKGIGFLKEGVPFNKTDHRMTDNLGFFTGNKMGKSDEKDSFRRMFRIDKEFHDEMADYIAPESYDEGDVYRHDSWKMAYMWYDYSRRLVEEQSCPQRTSDMMFFAKRPAQLRNQAMSLQREFKTYDKIQEIWRSASEEWALYGQEPISNTLGVTVTLDSMSEQEKKLQVFRADLDEIVPGLRKEMQDSLLAEANIPEEAMLAWQLPADQRDDEQKANARRVNKLINSADIDNQIADQASADKKMNAKRIAADIQGVIRQIQTIDKDSSTINYIFWKARTAAESGDFAVGARQLMFDAEEMRRKSIYDDEIDRDYLTKDVTITKRGAISLYENTFVKWNEVLNYYPDLKNGGLARELVDSMGEYQEMLWVTNRDWPLEFPLQELIDLRSKQGEMDGLPDSEELAEIRSQFSDEKREQMINDRLSKAQKPTMRLPEKPVAADIAKNKPKDKEDEDEDDKEDEDEKDKDEENK